MIKPKKRYGSSAGRKESDIESLSAEIKGLYENGYTYVEVIQAFNGRRGRTWIIRNWPKHASLSRLRALYHRGFSLDETVKKFQPWLETWVKLHWPEPASMPAQHAQIYAAQNVRPVKRWIAR